MLHNTFQHTIFSNWENVHWICIHYFLCWTELTIFRSWLGGSHPNTGFDTAGVEYSLNHYLPSASCILDASRNMTSYLFNSQVLDWDGDLHSWTPKLNMISSEKVRKAWVMFKIILSVVQHTFQWMPLLFLTNIVRDLRNSEITEVFKNRFNFITWFVNQNLRIDNSGNSCCCL